jgi:hypothetical protein
MSVTMGNAIRQLKLEISGSDIDMPEQDVRFVFSLRAIETYVFQGEGSFMSENRRLYTGSHHHRRRGHSGSCV